MSRQHIFLEKAIKSLWNATDWLQGSGLDMRLQEGKEEITRLIRMQLGHTSMYGATAGVLSTLPEGCKGSRRYLEKVADAIDDVQLAVSNALDVCVQNGELWCEDGVALFERRIVQVLNHRGSVYREPGHLIGYYFMLENIEHLLGFKVGMDLRVVGGVDVYNVKFFKTDMEGDEE